MERPEPQETDERSVFAGKQLTTHAEIVSKAIALGYRIYEIPISYSGRTYAEGKKITWRDGLAALGALLRYRFCD